MVILITAILIPNDYTFDITAILKILHDAIKSNGVSYPDFGEILPLSDIVPDFVNYYRVSWTIFPSHNRRNNSVAGYNINGRFPFLL